MSTVLGYAQSSDNSDSSLLLVICAGLVIAVCALAFIPMRLAWGRRHRRADTIVVVSIFWAMATVASLIYTPSRLEPSTGWLEPGTGWVVLHLNYSKERLLDIQTGYYDPQTTSDAPPLPWRTWSVLALVYGLVVVWSGSQRNPVPPGLNGPTEPQPPA